MKKIITLASLLILGLCAGCEAVSDMKDGVRERMNARNEPKVRVFSGDQRVVYAAALKALDGIGFRFVRGGPAQGKMEAVSAVSPNDSLNSSRQVVLKFTLAPSFAPQGQAKGEMTEMSLWLTEIIEADSSRQAGQGTSTPLRDTPLYEVYFRAVQQGLGGGSAEKTP